jgi:hypothetical protein
MIQILISTLNKSDTFLKMVCSRCRQVGHNRRNIRCPLLILSSRERERLIGYPASQVSSPREGTETRTTPVVYQASSTPSVPVISLLNQEGNIVHINENRYRRLSREDRRFVRNNLTAILTRIISIQLDINAEEQERIRLESSRQANLTKNHLKNMDIQLHLQDPGDTVLKDCNICLECKNTRDSVKTNCGHNFCCGCMMSYFESIKHKTGKPTCPTCRTHITILDTNFNDTCDRLKTHILSIV